MKECHAKNKLKNEKNQLTISLEDFEELSVSLRTLENDMQIKLNSGDLFLTLASLVVKKRFFVTQSSSIKYFKQLFSIQIT